MTTIIGLDAALANTGIAVWTEDLVNVSTVHTRPGLPAEERWEQIGAAIWPIVNPETLVVIEGVFSGAKMHGTALDLAMVQATIRMGLHYRRVPFAVVNNTHLKQYATGFAKATKREMIAATELLNLKFYVGDEHQADALWLVAMARHAYGAQWPDFAVGPAGMKALQGTNWPEWSGAKSLRRTPVVMWR